MADIKPKRTLLIKSRASSARLTVQYVEPSAAAYWPGKHGEQADWPVASEKVPEGQSAEEAAPVELTKEPAGAGVHVEAAA